MTIKAKMKNNLIYSLLFGGIAVALNFLLSFLVIPYITNRLGTEAYGFVGLANNFVQYMSIFTLALNSYATRYIGVEYHSKNMNKARSYYSTVVYSNVFLCIILLGFAIIFVWNIHSFIKIPQDLSYDVSILFLLMFINFIFNTMSSAFSPSAYVSNHMEKFNGLRVLAYLLEMVGMFYLFTKQTIHVWYVAIAYIIYSCSFLFGNYCIYRRYTADIRVSFRLFSIKNVKTLIVGGIWNSINSLGNILNSGLDLWISNLLLDSVAMGNIAIAKSMGGISTQIYSAISQVFQPTLLNLYAQGNKDKLINELKNVMKISGLVIGVFVGVFITVGKSFFRIWLPGQDYQTIYNLSIITMLSNVLEGMLGPLYYIYTLTVKNKIPCIITIAGGILNIIGMFLLIKNTNLGAYAVVITTAVIMIFINLVTNPIYMSHCLGCKKTTFYPILLRYVLFVVLSLLLGKFAQELIYINGWLELVVAAILSMLLEFIGYIFIVLDKKDRYNIWQKFNLHA